MPDMLVKNGLRSDFLLFYLYLNVYQISYGDVAVDTTQ